MGDERIRYRWSYSEKLALMLRLSRDRRLTQSAIAVASVLVDRADKATGRAFPSVASIVADSGVPKSTAIRALQALEQAGWVTAEKRFGAVSHYLLTGPEDGTGSTPGTGANLNLRRGGTGPEDGTNRFHARDTEQKEEDQKQQGRAALRASPADSGSKGQTFAEWVEGVPEGVSMDDLLTEGDQYAESIGLPTGRGVEIDFTLLAWEHFRHRHLPAVEESRKALAEAGSAARKRSTNWPGEYRKAIENATGGLWAFAREDRAPYLTTKGRQFAMACGLLTTKP